MIDENKLIERIEEAFYDEKYINCSAKDILFDVICMIDDQPEINGESNVTYCPRCGAETLNFYDDETVYCKECGFRFGVVKCEEE